MVGALLLYMAFLMLVDPLIRKPDAYTEQLHNEEENEVGPGVGEGDKVGGHLGLSCPHPHPLDALVWELGQNAPHLPGPSLSELTFPGRLLV